MVILVILVSISIAIALSIESIGVWSRAVGAQIGKSTFGYSLHVRIATLGRFFTIAAAPALGVLVDMGAEPSILAACGALTFGATFLILSFVNSTNDEWLMAIFLKLFGRDEPKLLRNIGVIEAKKPGQIFSWQCAFAFSFTAVGLILVNYFASIFPDWRSTVVQTTALITTSGTLVHVFLIDPKLARSGDNDPSLLVGQVKSFIRSRLVASGIISIIFMLLIFWGK